MPTAAPVRPPERQTPPLVAQSVTSGRHVVVQVVGAHVAARDTVTLVLALPGTRKAPAAYRPGQFITLALPAADGTALYRSYSLCGDGRADRPWEITVKRARGGMVSQYLIDRVRPGMQLTASLPQGAFTLPDTLDRTAPLIFVAAGSGITPISSMLRALARLDPARRPRVLLHYAYHSPEDAIFGRELAALDPEGNWLHQRRYVTTSGGRLRAADLVASLGKDASRAEWYVCGPTALKRELEAEAQQAGVPASRLHAEVFASPTSSRSGGRGATGQRASAGSIRLADSGATLDVRAGETLLEALERHGYGPAFSCRAGACGTCRLHLLAGHVCHGVGENGALSARERADGYILSCVAQPVGSITLASADPRVARLKWASSGSGASTGRARARSAPAHPRRRGPIKALRIGLIAAALSVFVTAWSLTNHAPASQAASTTTSSGSGSSSTSGGSGGSSSITTQPTQSSSSNSSTGVS